MDASASPWVADASPCPAPAGAHSASPSPDPLGRPWLCCPAGWGLPTDAGVSRAGLCRSGMAVPEIAASLVGECAVQLGQVIGAVGPSEFRLIIPALEGADPGDCPARSTSGPCSSAFTPPSSIGAVVGLLGSLPLSAVHRISAGRRAAGFADGSWRRRFRRRRRQRAVRPMRRQSSPGRWRGQARERLQLAGSVGGWAVPLHEHHGGVVIEAAAVVIQVVPDQLGCRVSGTGRSSEW